MNEHIVPIAAALLLTGCNSQAPNGTAPETGKATTVDRPEAASSGRSIDRLVYPGSQLTGDRFSTGEPIDRVVAWYWDPDHPVMQRNGETWAVDKPEKRDNGYLVHLGIVGEEDHKPFAIYLTPRAGGGTEGRIRPITEEEQRKGVEL